MRPTDVSALSKRLCLALALGLFGPAALAQAPPVAPKAAIVQPALDGVFEAFKTYPIVAMSDFHGLAQQQDFYSAIVRDPRFAREVGNVVVEFGAAQSQSIVDRYVGGEDLPYGELRKVWSDAIGWSPTVTDTGYVNFFVAVRQANAALPKEHHIHVWLGDPPVDWTTATAADVRRIFTTRDSYPAALIADNILAKQRKALVIYADGHLGAPLPRDTPSPGSEALLRKTIADVAKGEPDDASFIPPLAKIVRSDLVSQAEFRAKGAITGVKFIGGDRDGDAFEVAFTKAAPATFMLRRDSRGLIIMFSRTRQDDIRSTVEQRYPHSFRIIAPYTGFEQAACSQRFEQAHKDWPLPAFVSSIRGSPLEAELKAPGCTPLSMDAFLYFGPADRLTLSPSLPDLYLDAAFRAEISRRQILRGAPPLPPNPDMRGYTAAPAPLRKPSP